MPTSLETHIETIKKLSKLTQTWMLDNGLIKEPDNELPNRVMVINPSEAYPRKPVWSSMINKKYPNENDTTWSWVRLYMLRENIPIAYCNTMGEHQGWFIGSIRDVMVTSMASEKKAQTMTLNNAFADELLASQWLFGADDSEELRYFQKRAKHAIADRKHIASKTGQPYQHSLLEMLLLTAGDNHDN